MLSFDEIYLKKKCKIEVPTELYHQHNSVPQVATFLANIESLGFTLSKELTENLIKQPEGFVVSTYNEILPVLKEMVGDNVNHTPFYPNFPKQVMEASEAELFINAFLHYLTSNVHDITDGTVPVWKPFYRKDKRKKLNEQHDLKIIGLGNLDDFKNIFTELVSSNTSITDFDREVIEWFIDTFTMIHTLLPDEIPHKEQLSFTIGKMINRGIHPDAYKHYVNTATDVLRIAVSMSDGDTSLSQQTKFRNFKRKERKLLLELLESISYKIEDMNKYKNRWIKLGEKLNPGDYHKKFPNTAECFRVLRENMKVETFNSRVEHWISKGKVSKVCEMLTTRPGEFARSLDRLLRTFPKHNDEILLQFGKVAHKVSTPVLIQMYGHFCERVDTQHQSKYRFFFPKGKVSNAFVKKNDIEPLSILLVSNTIKVIINALHTKFSELESLGKMYIDPELMNYTVPLTMRNQLTGLNIVPRGSVFEFDVSTLRFFIHWKNVKNKLNGEEFEQRTDIDLSSTFLDENYNYVDHISYTNLRGLGCYHSGDFTTAPHSKGGSSEFLDVDIERLKSNGVRYIVPNIYSFSRQPFYEVPDCMFGWMSRKKPQSGEVFEPKTVQNKFNLTSESQVSVPCVIDIVNGEITWLDLSYDNFSGLRNVERTADPISVIIESFMSKQYMDMYSLLSIHELARGEKIESFEDVDESEIRKFTVDNIDWDEIMSEFLK